MRFHPSTFLLLMLLLVFGCRESSMMISNLSPKAIDGVLNLQMNHIAQDDLLIGQWLAPRLGRDKKFYRSPLTSYSGYVVDSFPYRAIVFPKLGQLNTQIFDVNEDPEATQVLSNGGFQ